MGLKTGGYYEFGEFRLEPDEHLLLRNGRVVALAPRAFDLLVFLVQSDGRLVSKDQILRTVWSGIFVEEANLTVTISALRKALGDRDSGTRHIETVPKKGYRFVVPVREVNPSTVPVPVPEAKVKNPEPQPNQAKPGEPDGQTLSEPPLELAALQNKDQSLDHQSERGLQPHAEGEEASARTPAAVLGAAVPRPSRRVLLGLVCAALALGAAAYLLVHRPSLVAALAQPRSLAILPLHNLGQDANSEFLSYSLADAVITKLDYVSSLSVRPSSAVEKYRGKVIDIPAVAADLKVDTLLTGGFLREGDNLRITYQLIDAKAERLLGRGTIDLKYDNLLRVQDAVAEQIIRTLQLKLSRAEADRLKPAISVSPLAYEYYLRGVDLHGQHNFPLAIEMLERSTEIDPNYALAWAYLGAAYNSDAAFKLGGREQYRRARAAYERALALEPSQLDAKMFLANLLIDTGKVEEAVPLLREALNANINYAPLHWELGYAYRFAGMLNESVAECEQALSLDPLVKSNGSVLNTYLYRGEYAKFLTSLPEVDESAFLLFYRGFGEYYQRNWTRASKDFDRAFEIDSSLYTRIGKALSDSIAHREVDGLAILRDLEREIVKRGVGDPEGLYKLAQSYAALGDTASALRVLRGSVDGGFFPYSYLMTDPLLEQLRKEAEFIDILDVSRRRYQAFKEKFFNSQMASNKVQADR